MKRLRPDASSQLLGGFTPSHRPQGAKGRKGVAAQGGGVTTMLDQVKERTPGVPDPMPSGENAPGAAAAAAADAAVAVEGYVPKAKPGGKALTQQDGRTNSVEGALKKSGALPAGAGQSRASEQDKGSEGKVAVLGGTALHGGTTPLMSQSDTGKDGDQTSGGREVQTPPQLEALLGKKSGESKPEGSAATTGSSKGSSENGRRAKVGNAVSRNLQRLVIDVSATQPMPGGQATILKVGTIASAPLKLPPPKVHTPAPALAKPLITPLEAHLCSAASLHVPDLGETPSLAAAAHPTTKPGSSVVRPQSPGLGSIQPGVALPALVEFQVADGKGSIGSASLDGGPLDLNSLDAGAPMFVFNMMTAAKEGASGGEQAQMIGELRVAAPMFVYNMVTEAKEGASGGEQAQMIGELRVAGALVVVWVRVFLCALDPSSLDAGTPMFVYNMVTEAKEGASGGEQAQMIGELRVAAPMFVYNMVTEAKEGASGGEQAQMIGELKMAGALVVVWVRVFLCALDLSSLDAGAPMFVYNMMTAAKEGASGGEQAQMIGELRVAAPMFVYNMVTEAKEGASGGEQAQMIGELRMAGALVVVWVCVFLCALDLSSLDAGAPMFVYNMVTEAKEGASGGEQAQMIGELRVAAPMFMYNMVAEAKEGASGGEQAQMIGELRVAAPMFVYNMVTEAKEGGSGGEQAQMIGELRVAGNPTGELTEENQGIIVDGNGVTEPTVPPEFNIWFPKDAALSKASPAETNSTTTAGPSQPPPAAAPAPLKDAALLKASPAEIRSTTTAGPSPPPLAASPAPLKDAALSKAFPAESSSTTTAPAEINSPTTSAAGTNSTTTAVSSDVPKPTISKLRKFQPTAKPRRPTILLDGPPPAQGWPLQVGMGGSTKSTASSTTRSSTRSMFISAASTNNRHQAAGGATPKSAPLQQPPREVLPFEDPASALNHGPSKVHIVRIRSTKARPPAPYMNEPIYCSDDNEEDEDDAYLDGDRDEYPGMAGPSDEDDDPRTDGFGSEGEGSDDEEGIEAGSGRKEGGGKGSGVEDGEALSGGRDGRGKGSGRGEGLGENDEEQGVQDESEDEEHDISTHVDETYHDEEESEFIDLRTDTPRDGDEDGMGMGARGSRDGEGGKGMCSDDDEHSDGLPPGMGSDEEEEGEFGEAGPFFGAPPGGFKVELGAFAMLWTWVGQWVSTRTVAFFSEEGDRGSEAGRPVEADTGTLVEEGARSRGEDLAESELFALAASCRRPDDSEPLGSGYSGKESSYRGENFAPLHPVDQLSGAYAAMAHMLEPSVAKAEQWQLLAVAILGALAASDNLPGFRVDIDPAASLARGKSEVVEAVGKGAESLLVSVGFSVYEYRSIVDRLRGEDD
eukprot:gene18306-24766_t